MRVKMMLKDSERPIPPSQRKLPERHSARDRTSPQGAAHHNVSRKSTTHIDPANIKSEDDMLAQLSRSHRAQKLAMDELAYQENATHDSADNPDNKVRSKMARKFTAPIANRNIATRRMAIALIFAVILVVTDQMSKAIIREYLQRWGTNFIPVNDYFAWVSAWNPGVSFGFFSASGETGDIIFKLLDIVVSIYLLWRIATTSNFWQNCGSVLVMGGAMGNFFDRLEFGAVYDFLLFHIGEWRYPAFNLADTWITLGVIIMILDWKFGNDDDEATDAKK